MEGKYPESSPTTVLFVCDTSWWHYLLPVWCCKAEVTFRVQSQRLALTSLWLTQTHWCGFGVIVGRDDDAAVAQLFHLMWETGGKQWIYMKIKLLLVSEDKKLNFKANVIKISIWKCCIRYSVCCITEPTNVYELTEPFNVRYAVINRGHTQRLTYSIWCQMYELTLHHINENTNNLLLIILTNISHITKLWNTFLSLLVLHFTCCMFHV